MATRSPRFTADEYAARLAGTRAAMESAGVEVLVVTDPANMCWLTGYDGWSFYVHQCVVIGPDGACLWFGRGIDAAGARLLTDLADDSIIAYEDRFVQSPDIHPMDVLAGIIKDRGWGAKPIGVEMDNYYFSARAMKSLEHHLPDARFIDTTGLVNRQRAVKSETEIGYMRAAGTVIEKVYERIMEVAEPGMRKNDLVAEIYHAGIRGSDEHYGDYPAIVPLIATGEEASFCHMTWNGDALKKSEGMIMELAGVHNRYHCPCSRTLYFGAPPDSYRRIEEVFLDCLAKTIPSFRPGVTCGEVADMFFTTLEKNGYEKDNRCGYSIGLNYPPDWGEGTMSLRRSDTTVIEAGMCFHLMAGIWFDDWGFEMTESVLVTQDGGDCLSSVPRELLVKR